MTPSARLLKPIHPLTLGLVLVLLLLAPTAVRSDQPNILVILIDDLGIEHLDSYDIQEGQVPETYASTINLDTFSENAVNFDQAWSAPLCSPTRMWIQSGLLGFKTGVGTTIEPLDSFQPDLSETYFVADLLKGHASSPYATTAQFGKWHLGAADAGAGLDAPGDIGYDTYKSIYQRFNANDPDYFDYVPVFDGVEQPAVTDSYLTHDTAQWAIDWLEQSPEGPDEPWFAYVAFNGVHSPFHCPPNQSPIPYYPNLPSCDGDIGSTADAAIDEYHAMTYSIDVEIGRILDALDTHSAASHTLVIIASDNGSPKEVVLPPVEDEKAKAQVYQGGVRVPLMIGGAAADLDTSLLGTFVQAPVMLSDIYDTILEVAEVGPATHSGLLNNHSASLVPYMSGNTPTERDCIYTEIFNPNDLQPSNHSRYDLAVRGEDDVTLDDYKLVYMRSSQTKELYRLTENGLDDDEWELDDLYGSNKQLASELLKCANDTFFEDFCILAKLNKPCEFDSDCCSNNCLDTGGVIDYCIAP